jgi:iron-sulfur cluster assembly protein
MALDEPQENDQVFDDKGVTFLVNKSLLEEVKPINVDFITTPQGSGFKVTSSLTKAANEGCGSCSC